MEKFRGASPFVDVDVKDIPGILIQGPDGITTIVLCVLFLIMGLFPVVVSQLGIFFHFELAKNTSSYMFLLFPILFFLIYMRLSGINTSRIGAYFNALMLIAAASLFFNASIVWRI
ncbi:MAG: hypothetical protein LLG15_00430 [Betaproteobacteria bacterium]|nr:hypothetical protein [Betaproteobacteria bacterium]